MLITAVKMGEKFGLLPSEVMQRATSFDYMALDVFETYDGYKQSGKKPNYSTDQLSEMMKTARKEK
jgi:hypothetical protein